MCVQLHVPNLLANGFFAFEETHIMLGVCPTFGEETRLAWCGTACGYCFAIPAGTSEHTSKRTIHLRYLLVQVVREHQPADHTYDTATQTDDEHFPSPGTVSELISRTVQEQIATLANLLRRTQEQSEAMAERCRTLEERQSQVQLQDVRFSSAPPASDRVRFVNAVAYRVRKLLLQHRRRTAQ